MDRYDFVDKLEVELRLAGASQSLINENLDYYEDYFRDEMNKGRSEEEIIAELGEPRLLAKSIVDAAADIALGDRNVDTQVVDEDGKAQDAGYGGYEAGSSSRGSRVTLTGFKAILALVLIVVAAVIIIGIAIRIIGGIIGILLPIVIPVLAVLLIIHFLKNMSR